MAIDCRTLAIALAILLAAPVVAQPQNPRGEQGATKNQRTDRAAERCRLNHGVNCDTPEGLKEWLLLERSREKAIRDGSRHPLPAKPKPAPSRP